MQLKTSNASLAAICLAAALVVSACDNDSGDAKTNARAVNSSAASAPNTSAGQSLDDEIARLERLAERSPNDDAARSQLAVLYVRRGNNLRAANDLAGALKDYQSAIQYDPDNEEALKNVAELRPQVEGERTGEYGEPEPLPITPSVTSGEESAPTTQPTSGRNNNR